MENVTGRRPAAKAVSPDGMESTPIDTDAPPFGLPAVATPWVGEYAGHVDGKPSTLKISKNPAETALSLTLTHTEPNQEFSGGGTFAAGGSAHVLNDVVLTSADGNSGKTLAQLLLHTWNDNRISGYSAWRNRTYGSPSARPSAERRGGSLRSALQRSFA